MAAPPVPRSPAIKNVEPIKALKFLPLSQSLEKRDGRGCDDNQVIKNRSSKSFALPRPIRGELLIVTPLASG